MYKLVVDREGAIAVNNGRKRDGLVSAGGPTRGRSKEARFSAFEGGAMSVRKVGNTLLSPLACSLLELDTVVSYQVTGSRDVLRA